MNVKRYTYICKNDGIGIHFLAVLFVANRVRQMEFARSLRNTYTFTVSSVATSTKMGVYVAFGFMERRIRNSTIKRKPKRTIVCVSKESPNEICYFHLFAVLLHLLFRLLSVRAGISSAFYGEAKRKR